MCVDFFNLSNSAYFLPHPRAIAVETPATGSIVTSWITTCRWFKLRENEKK